MKPDDSFPSQKNWTPELLKQRRKNALIMAIILVGLVVLFFFTTIVRMKGG